MRKSWRNKTLAVVQLESDKLLLNELLELQSRWKLRDFRRVLNSWQVQAFPLYTRRGLPVIWWNLLRKGNCITCCRAEGWTRHVWCRKGFVRADDRKHSLKWYYSEKSSVLFIMLQGRIINESSHRVMDVLANITQCRAHVAVAQVMKAYFT